MKCSDARELINAYIDNGFDPSNDRLLQEHIAGCEKCRAELEFLVSYKKRIEGIKPVKAPAGFMHELRRRIEAENSRPLQRYYGIISDYIRSIHFPVEAAALVVLVSIIFTLYRPDKLFMNRPEVTVAEYSETSSKKTDVTISKDEGVLPGSAERKVHDKNRISTRPTVIPDKSYTGDKEMAKAGEIADDIKQESEGSEKLASPEERKYETNTVESAAADKKETYRSERKVMGKQKLDAAAELSPADICRSYNAGIVKTRKLSSGTVEYTIEVRDNNSEALMAGLRRHFAVTYRSKDIINNRTYIIIEIME